MEPQPELTTAQPPPETPTPPKRKRGRPRILDETKRAQICAMLSLGCSKQTAAQYVGVTANPVRNAARRYPDFHEQLLKALRASEVSALRHLHNAAANNWRAAAWLLERTNPQQYGYRTHRQLSADYWRIAHEDMIQDMLQLLPDEKSRAWFLRRMDRADAKRKSALIDREAPFFEPAPRTLPPAFNAADWPDDPPPRIAITQCDQSNLDQSERVPLPTCPAVRNDLSENVPQIANDSSQNAQSDGPAAHFGALIPQN